MVQPRSGCASLSSVHALTLIDALYGQGRGYRRLDIRRRVAANQRLSREALTRINDEAFQHHVHRSIARFPWYAQRVQAYRGSLPAPGERVSPVEFPVWTRDDQRAFFAQQSPPPESHYARRTSGSTGQPVDFRVTRESYEWRTAVMNRAYSWAGAEECVKSVYVWGLDAHRESFSHRIKHALHLLLQRRSYVDVFQKFSDAERAACCEMINRVKPKAIVGYTGMLVDIARYARDHKALTWKARSIVCAAEELLPGQRELLETHLAGEVFKSYGCREFMSIGMECERHAGYHIATDNLRVDVVDDTGQPVPEGKAGRIVITDLHNAATPFVRYDVGDIGVMEPPGEACACGRPFPILKRVEGRVQDMIQTREGPVTALYVTNIWKFDWVEGFQVVQHEVDRILVRLLTSVELTPERLAPVTAMLQHKLGDVTIDYERVDALSRRPNGKVDMVVSSLTGEEPLPG